jgi:maltooligosyltrehalose trehalohydrolase
MLAETEKYDIEIGAVYKGNGRCDFFLWAPGREDVELKIVYPSERKISMRKDNRGYWSAGPENVYPGCRYFYSVGGEKDLPDPASHFQPEGVHGPSEVFDHEDFAWTDSSWKGHDLSELIIYEIHVGTFTPEETFDGVIARLDDLKDLGINALEIMPVAQFPGGRDWGYDGAFPFAVQNTYGGPDGLKRLVDACHARDMAVILDVVYNHLGPEGNYLREFGPYFTNTYCTPWGQAINFDGEYSDDVRNFFLDNAIYWFERFHMDALRLDAVHAIYDFSAKPFLVQLSERVRLLSEQKGRKLYLIAESDRNDIKVISPVQNGGYGIDAQWNDDFHHALHSLITGERSGYYMDFGRTGQVAKALREGYVYSWEYSGFRKRRHGTSSAGRPASQFIVACQNHDQTGNRMLGERLSSLVSFEALKAAAGLLFLSPYIPLLFMGEEYGEDNPFLYFVSHCDPDLITAVRNGRKAEFSSFQWSDEVPDPQHTDTFLRSKLAWEKRMKKSNSCLLSFYRLLIELRKTVPAISTLDNKKLYVSFSEEEKMIVLRRWEGESHVCAIFNFQNTDSALKMILPEGNWKKIIDSSDEIWGGPGPLSPGSVADGDEMLFRASSMAAYMLESE